MKFCVISPCENGAIDGTVNQNLLACLPNQVSAHETDVIVIPISFYGDFQFRRNLASIVRGKKLVVMDFTELGLDWIPTSGIDTHVLGRNSAEFTRVSTPEWMMLDAFIRDHPPVAYFKRELLAREVTDRLLPICFPCYLEPMETESKEGFDRRPVEVIHSWGYSNNARPRLHADIFRGIFTHQLGIIDHWDQWAGYFSTPRGRTWMSVFSPHYVRRSIHDILWFQRQSKISVSLPGAGSICFRHTESPIGSIMALHDDGIAWPYEWKHGENCIRIRPEHEFEDLEAATHRDDLWEIYRNGQHAIERYRSAKFVNDYIVPAIERNL